MIHSLLLQAAAVDPAAMTPWTPAMITALFGGIAGIIIALGSVIVQLRAAKKVAAVAAGHAESAAAAADEARKSVDESRRIGAQVGDERDRKLDVITTLVDGRYSEILDRVASLTRAIADSTGQADDIKTADEAQRVAEEQRARLRAALLVSRGGV